MSSVSSSIHDMHCTCHGRSAESNDTPNPNCCCCAKSLANVGLIAHHTITTVIHSFCKPCHQSFGYVMRTAKPTLEGLAEEEKITELTEGGLLRLMRMKYTQEEWIKYHRFTQVVNVTPNESKTDNPNTLDENNEMQLRLEIISREYRSAYGCNLRLPITEADLYELLQKWKRYILMYPYFGPPTGITIATPTTMT